MLLDRIYVNFKDAGKLSKDNCSIHTTPRSLEFNIASTSTFFEPWFSLLI